VVRRILALAALGAAGAWVADRWLAGRRGDAPLPALEMLVVVDVPIEAVWDVIADVPRQLEWMRDMKSVRIDTPGTIGVGMRAEATVRVLGIPVTDPVIIVGFEPPHRYAIRHLGLFEGDGVFTLEAGADGTTTIVRWEERLEAPLLPDLGAIVQAPILRAVFQADLVRMKRLVETGSADG
jgi:hypothetical protein